MWAFGQGLGFERLPQRAGCAELRPLIGVTGAGWRNPRQPGPADYGVVVLDAATGKALAERCGGVGARSALMRFERIPRAAAPAPTSWPAG